MIVVTHEMGFAREVGDTVVFMDGGVVVESGDPTAVLTDPQHERTTVVPVQGALTGGAPSPDRPARWSVDQRRASRWARSEARRSASAALTGAPQRRPERERIDQAAARPSAGSAAARSSGPACARRSTFPFDISAALVSRRTSPDVAARIPVAAGGPDRTRCCTSRRPRAPRRPPGRPPRRWPGPGPARPRGWRRPPPTRASCRAPTALWIDRVCREASASTPARRRRRPGWSTDLAGHPVEQLRRCGAYPLPASVRIRPRPPAPPPARWRRTPPPVGRPTSGSPLRPEQRGEGLGAEARPGPGPGATPGAWSRPRRLSRCSRGSGPCRESADRPAVSAGRPGTGAGTHHPM